MTSKSKFSIWAVIGIGLLFILSILIIGNILTIGDHLQGIHPALSIVFYIFTVLVFIYLILLPVLSVAAMSPIKVRDYIDDNSNEPNTAQATKVARSLLRKGRLEVGEKRALSAILKKGENPSDMLEKIFENRLNQMDAIVRKYAKQVFVSTALSQNGRLDAVLVIMINFRMLRDIIRCYGYRPTFKHLVKMYTQVLAAALIADGIEDIEFAEVFPVLSKGFLGVIPGLGILSSSLLQGTGNAFLTLRVGIITRNYYITAGSGFSRREARRAAIGPALKQLRLIIKESLPFFSRKAQRKASEELNLG
jgi:uncharacterized membrane protein YcjF (UPF0283 family)